MEITHCALLHRARTGYVWKPVVCRGLRSPPAMPAPTPPVPPSDHPVPETEPVRVSVAQFDRERHPNLGTLQAVELREGPRSRREARYTVIRSSHTGAVKHDAVTIKSFKRREGEWREDLAHSITLSSEGDIDEIQRLVDFVTAARSGGGSEQSADYLVVTTPAGGVDPVAIQRALRTLSASGRVDVLADVLEGVIGDPEMLRALARRAQQTPDSFTEAAAALNLATFHQAIRKLKSLVAKQDVLESEFHVLLQANPWMFGSEYSELLERRRWTRDEQHDFMLRRTTDGYLEVIEIKTPLNGAPLFQLDKSHNSYYASSVLSKVIGQVEKYIEELDASRNAIVASDGEDTAKIRAKIVIGRTGDAEQVKALRRFNSHLHRIEIITFDQLVRIAQKVTSYLWQALR
jgi:hypothetical protein